METAEHDHPERGRDENQKQLSRPQEGEVSGPREDGEADRRSGDVGPRRERHRVFADDPVVQAAPYEADREDDERDADEEALSEALVCRVPRIRSEGEDAIENRRCHDRRA